MSQFPATGAYILLIRVEDPVSIPIGKLGDIDFKRGWYTYVGSAMGQTATSLHHRVRRHFAPATQKRLHWHVDYLLTSANCKVLGAVIVRSTLKLECLLVPVIQFMGGQPWGTRFGASDCSTCASHLLFFHTLGTDLSPAQILTQLQTEVNKSGFAAEVVLKI